MIGGDGSEDGRCCIIAWDRGRNIKLRDPTLGTRLLMTCRSMDMYPNCNDDDDDDDDDNDDGNDDDDDGHNIDTCDDVCCYYCKMPLIVCSKSSDFFHV